VSAYHDRVQLVCDGKGEIVARITPAKRHEMLRNFRRSLASLEATWEPHDWADFGPFADGGYIGGGS
jgi:hypothetical protein